MAFGTSIKSGKVLFLLGNSATPIVYTAPCALTEKSLRLQKATTETEMVDCADPDLPGWLEHDVTSRRLSISGGGVLVVEAVPAWLDAFDADGPVAGRVEIHTGSSAIFAYTGLIHVTTLEFVGNSQDGRAQVRIEAESHGVMVRTSPAG